MGRLFDLSVVSLAIQKLFSFNATLVLNTWTDRVLGSESFPTPVSCRALPMFSSSSCNVPDFQLKPSIPLELAFVQGKRQGSNSILLHTGIHFTQLS